MSAIPLARLSDLANIENVLVNHDPSRSLTLAEVSGVPAAGEEVTFGWTGATGKVVAWNAPSLRLDYVLTAIAEVPVRGLAVPLMPADGEPVGFEGGASARVIAQQPAGDIAPNPPHTVSASVVLVARTLTTAAVRLVVRGSGKCSQGFLHDAAFWVPPGSPIAIAGPFDRHRFGARDGYAESMRVEYVGTAAATDLGIGVVQVIGRP